MEQNQNTSLFSMSLDAQNSYTLRSMASWAKVLGVVSIIIAVICVILGVVMQQAISRYDSYSYRSSGLSANALGNAGLITYVILGLLYGLSGIFAMNAGNKINSGLRSNSMETLNSGFAAARNFFAFWAILVILFLLLILISLLSALSA